MNQQCKDQREGTPHHLSRRPQPLFHPPHRHSKKQEAGRGSTAGQSRWVTLETRAREPGAGWGAATGGRQEDPQQVRAAAEGWGGAQRLGRGAGMSWGRGRRSSGTTHGGLRSGTKRNFTENQFREESARSFGSCGSRNGKNRVEMRPEEARADGC